MLFSIRFMYHLTKISTIETRKNELKHQMKNTEQKTLITYKKVNRLYFCSPFIVSTLFIKFHTVF